VLTFCILINSKIFLCKNKLPGYTLCLHKGREVYNILFQSVWHTLNTFGHDHKWLGAQTGMISILHTWGQTMTLHPHLHCIVPGGGLTKAGKWKTAKSDGKYLFNVKAMSKVFRGKFIALLKERLPAEMDKQFIDELYKKDWVVYLPAGRQVLNVLSAGRKL